MFVIDPIPFIFYHFDVPILLFTFLEYKGLIHAQSHPRKPSKFLFKNFYILLNLHLYVYLVYIGFDKLTCQWIVIFFLNIFIFTNNTCFPFCLFSMYLYIKMNECTIKLPVDESFLYHISKNHAKSAIRSDA
jgi:hypothetical protein